MDPVELARALIRCPSVTPKDEGALDTLQQALESIGFTCRRLRFEEVDNLYARLGSEAPNFCYAGHTDVVPPGDDALWRHPPFAAEVKMLATRTSRAAIPSASGPLCLPPG